MLTFEDSVGLILQHGVVLESANGPVPNLVAAIVGAPVRGSWWSHPQGRQIYAVLQRVMTHPDIALCRLVNAKRTLLHRRVWPALLPLADQFSAAQLARLQEQHTARGHHAIVSTPFPDWLPAEMRQAGTQLSVGDARALLGNWLGEPGNVPITKPTGNKQGR